MGEQIDMTFQEFLNLNTVNQYLFDDYYGIDEAVRIGGQYLPPDFAGYEIRRIWFEAVIDKNGNDIMLEVSEDEFQKNPENFRTTLNYDEVLDIIPFDEFCQGIIEHMQFLEQDFCDEVQKFIPSENRSLSHERIQNILEQLLWNSAGLEDIAKKKHKYGFKTNRLQDFIVINYSQSYLDVREWLFEYYSKYYELERMEPLTSAKERIDAKGVIWQRLAWLFASGSLCYEKRAGVGWSWYYNDNPFKSANQVATEISKDLGIGTSSLRPYLSSTANGARSDKNIFRMENHQKLLEIKNGVIESGEQISTFFQSQLDNLNVS